MSLSLFVAVALTCELTCELTSALTGTSTGAGIPEGASQMQVRLEDTDLELFTYKPAGYRDGPLIMVFHGVLRNADEYRDHARGMGDRFGALIVAPRFPEPEFPLEKYQLGGLRVNGSVRPAGEWTWRFVPQVVREVRKREERPDLPFYLIGHSGGGQFLIRMSGFTSTGASRIVVANAGTLLFPSREQAFPYGFGELPDPLSNDEALRRYLEQPVTLYLGSKDLERDEYLDVKAPAERQGSTRWQRGNNAYRAAQQLADEKGWNFGWRLVVADGIEHDHEKMFDNPACKTALFGERN